MAGRSACPPRKWNSDSKKWESKMKKLANMPDNEVTQVGNLTFVPEKKFQIAQNGQTEVLLGLWHDGTELAIKKMPLSEFSKVKTTLKKLEKSEFNRQNIVAYIDTAKDGNFGYIALKLCEDNLEKRKKALPSNGDLKGKVQEFLTSLCDLHEKKVIHGNIKPQNVLFDSAGKLKVGDFGDLNMGQTTEDGAGWKATEILKDPSTKSSLNSDVQVAGMLIYYMLSGGKHPFGDASRRKTNISVGKYSLQNIDVEAKDLIESMIDINPKKRPKISDVLQHPYFWNGDKKKAFLKNAGEVKDLKKATKAQQAKLMDLTKGKSFSKWKSEVPDFNLKDKWLALVQKHGKDDVEYPENMLGLLHFIKSHSGKAGMKEINVMFPDLIVTVYKYAKEKKWDILKLDTAVKAPTQKRKADTATTSQAAEAPPAKKNSDTPLQRSAGDENKGSAFLTTHKADLEKRMNIINILSHLQQKGVLSNLEWEQVESKSTNREKNLTLLTVIENKGAKARQVFYEVLKENDKFLVEDLEGYV